MVECIYLNGVNLLSVIHPIEPPALGWIEKKGDIVRIFKYVALALLSMAAGSALFTWVLVARYNMIIGHDFWYSLSVSRVFEITDNTSVGATLLMFAGCFMGSILGLSALLIVYAVIHRRSGIERPNDAHTDYVYSGSFSSGGSDGGFSD